VNPPTPFPILENVLAIRGIGVTFYALKDGERLYLVDAGFVGGAALLRRKLKQRGWEKLPIAGILLTHGHLDHVLNATKIASESGAWVAAHRMESTQIAGRYPHRGSSRICGLLESAGRRCFRYVPPHITRWFEDGEELEVFGGLQVVHLPGHTEGHVGFHHTKSGLLFCGDLFASFPLISHPPPNILNSHPSMLPGSLVRALAVQPRGILPNHGDGASPTTHLERLKKLAARYID
jgi:glyoxylase-like metal-dependent hydrolase (beta-lactamase superfamily II)